MSARSVARMRAVCSSRRLVQRRRIHGAQSTETPTRAASTAPATCHSSAMLVPRTSRATRPSRVKPRPTTSQIQRTGRRPPSGLLSSSCDQKKIAPMTMATTGTTTSACTSKPTLPSHRAPAATRAATPSRVMTTAWLLLRSHDRRAATSMPWWRGAAPRRPVWQHAGDGDDAVGGQPCRRPRPAGEPADRPEGAARSGGGGRHTGKGCGRALLEHRGPQEDVDDEACTERDAGGDEGDADPADRQPEVRCEADGDTGEHLVVAVADEWRALLGAPRGQGSTDRLRWLRLLHGALLTARHGLHVPILAHPEGWGRPSGPGLGVASGSAQGRPSWLSPSGGASLET